MPTVNRPRIRVIGAMLGNAEQAPRARRIVYRDDSLHARWNLLGEQDAAWAPEPVALLDRGLSIFLVGIAIGVVVAFALVLTIGGRAL